MVETRDRAFGIAQSRPDETVNGDEREAKHRHNETAGEIVAIGDRAHHFRQNRAAHDRHDDEGRAFFARCPRPKMPSAKMVGNMIDMKK